MEDFNTYKEFRTSDYTSVKGSIEFTFRLFKEKTK